MSFDDLYRGAELDKDQTLAEILGDALQSEGRRRFTLLKFTGDLALFVSGFFSDSIARRRVDLDYYVRMGGYAYGRAARLSPGEAAEVYYELSAKFGRFVDSAQRGERGERALRWWEAFCVSTRSGFKRAAGRSEALLRREGIQLGTTPRVIH